MKQRMTRWPIVHLLHPLLDPLTAGAGAIAGMRGSAAWAGVKTMAGPDRPESAGAGVLPHAYETFRADQGPPAVQATFATLQQSDPAAGNLYRRRKLWEAEEAMAAWSELEQRIADFIRNLQDRMADRLARRAALFAPLRWLITYGIVVWFIIAQPLLEAWLDEGAEWKLPLVLVRMFGVPYLLKSALFLLIYFAALWLLLKWNTSRRVERELTRCKLVDPTDPTVSLTGQVLEWLAGLLAPIRREREKVNGLIRRARELRGEPESPIADRSGRE
jgi:hypothetical protein